VVVEVAAAVEELPSGCVGAAAGGAAGGGAPSCTVCGSAAGASCCGGMASALTQLPGAEDGRSQMRPSSHSPSVSPQSSPSLLVFVLLLRSWHVGVCLFAQHHSFFSSDQPCSHLSKPASQSK